MREKTMKNTLKWRYHLNGQCSQNAKEVEGKLGDYREIKKANPKRL
jgi:hypothetical protein